jgi:predicted DsbA family dithiol-disulfide isomerase
MIMAKQTGIWGKLRKEARLDGESVWELCAEAEITFRNCFERFDQKKHYAFPAYLRKTLIYDPWRRVFPRSAKRPDLQIADEIDEEQAQSVTEAEADSDPEDGRDAVSQTAIQGRLAEREARRHLWQKLKGELSSEQKRILAAEYWVRKSGIVSSQIRKGIAARTGIPVERVRRLLRVREDVAAGVLGRKQLGEAGIRVPRRRRRKEK